MKKLNIIVITLSILITLTSCATFGGVEEEINPLSIFDENATMYAHVKVNGNEDELKKLLLDNISDLDKDSIDVILSQSQSLYIAAFDESYAQGSNIQLALQGSFPTFIVNTSLNEKKGWVNHTAEIQNVKYNYKEHTTGIQLASISSSLIVLSTKNVSTMQERYRNKNLTEVSWPVAYEESGLLTPINDLFVNETSISLYIPNARSFLPTILQAPIELAIDYAFGTIKLLEDNTQTMDIQLKMENERVAKGTLTLLRLATITSDISVELVDDTIIMLSNIPFSSYIFGTI